MEIKIICVGGVKQSWYKDACAEYVKRLRGVAVVNIIEIKEQSHLPTIQALAAEAKQILPKLKGRVIVLDIGAPCADSEEFSRIISGFLDSGGAAISFVIGGSNGLCNEVKQRADSLLSFSRMTFPHTLFRVMLLEQIYRAFSIMSGSPYHK